MGIHTKRLPLHPNPPPPRLFSSPMPVSHFHAPFQGEGGGGKRQINKLSFQSLYSRRELDEEAAGSGGGFGRGGPAASN